VVILAAGGLVAFQLSGKGHPSTAPPVTQTTVVSTTEAGGDSVESTTTLPPPTAAPASVVTGSPIMVASSAPSEVIAAVNVVQAVANALAQHDWAKARGIYPTIQSDDSQLESGYGGLSASTVEVTGWSDPGTGAPVSVDGAYVAWETVHGNQQTSIYCISWSVSLDNTLLHETSIGTDSVPFSSGWIDPQSLTQAVQSHCGT
jgi:hypothetical protein